MGEILVNRVYECFEEFAANALIWNLDFRQLSRSESKTLGVQLSVGGMFMSRTAFGCQLDQRAESPEGMYTFALALKRCSPIYINGKNVKPGSLILLGKNRDHRSISRSGFEVFTYSIPQYLLDEWFENVARASFREHFHDESTVLELNDKQVDTVAAVYQIGESIVRNQRPYIEETLLVEVFLTAIRDIYKEPQQHRLNLMNRRQDLVNQVLIYGRECSNSKLSVTSLCHRLGISERRLQQVFKTEIGDLTPKSYLLSQRLYLAYRMLRNTEPVVGGVSHVAEMLEFSNLSKFSEAYYRLIGELPSDTLKRPRFV